jgi:hypothetical protein
VRLFISILFATLFHAGWSQTFTAKCSHETVSQGERVKIVYTIEGGDGKKFVQPTFTGFRLLGGPNTSSNMQWVNGVHSSSKSFSFILLADKVGTHTIAPAKIKTKDRVIDSNPIVIIVTKSKKKKQSANQSTTNKTTEDGTTDLSSDLFMKLFVDKRKTFVGQQITATYKLYLHSQVVNYSHNRPVFNGFYAQEIKIDPNAEITTETINGKQFRVATMKKVVLTPQKSGKLEIPPLEMELIVRMEGKRRRSGWGSFPTYKDVKVEVKSNVEKIDVTPLPIKDQPDDFAGAVGKFAIKASTDLEKVNVNEAVNLVFRVEGKGNIELISEPSLDFPQDFEHYDPKIKQSVSTTASGTKGFKTFEYVLIPRYPGDFELPSFTMSYFDPISGLYKRLKTDPIKISVSKNGNVDQRGEMAYVAPKKEDVQIIGKDIRHIKSSSGALRSTNESFFDSIGFYAVTGLPLASLGLFMFMVKGIRKRGLDVVSTKSRQARAMAKKHLKVAKSSISATDQEFYEEIYKALFGYLSDKFNIQVSDLNKESILANLASKGASETLSADLIEVLNECEIARFAPMAARARTDMLANSESIIERIEDEI